VAIATFASAARSWNLSADDAPLPLDSAFPLTSAGSDSSRTQRPSRAGPHRPESSVTKCRGRWPNKTAPPYESHMTSGIRTEACTWKAPHVPNYTRQRRTHLRSPSIRPWCSCGIGSHPVRGRSSSSRATRPTLPLVTLVDRRTKRVTPLLVHRSRHDSSPPDMCRRAIEECVHESHAGTRGGAAELSRADRSCAINVDVGVLSWVLEFCGRGQPLATTSTTGRSAAPSALRCGSRQTARARSTGHVTVTSQSTRA
jgi:hypothetical protein